MKIKEISAKDLQAEEFVTQKVRELSTIVGDGLAITALSGGVDSATVTVLGHRALGERLKVYFVDNGLMRLNEPQQVVSLFDKLNICVNVVDAKAKFFNELKGITDPEAKREVISHTFYKDIFANLVRKSGAKCLLQGTILTDVDETIAGIKRQHNVLEQLGIEPEKEFGYKIIEPLIQLRKDGVRKVAVALGLPEEIYDRMPFLGPGLAGRVIGEVTPDRVETVRQATAITEEELVGCGAFQYLAILHEDRVTGIRAGKRDYGLQIEIRCWDSVDARSATPTKLPYERLEKLAKRVTSEVYGVVSVTYNITPKPPSTIEAI